jgi:transposase-like protein
MLAFAAERMMDMEIEARPGAVAGSRSPARLNHRNGYRERVGTPALADRSGDPKLRKGSYFRASWSRAAPPRRLWQR